MNIWRRNIKTIAILLALAALGEIAVAGTPGSSPSYWKPERIAQLSADEIHDLQKAGCLVTSYRSEDVPNFTVNKSKQPDEQDQLMLIRGEFAAKGQTDVAVLCTSVDQSREFLHIVWGGPTRCASTLPLASVSMFWKKRDPVTDYYGSHMKKFEPSEITGYLNSVREEFKTASPREGMDGITKYWIRPTRSMPKFDHDSMAFFGSYSFIHYCDGQQWIKLYDFYSTVSD
jgi:hypothetical protein